MSLLDSPEIWVGLYLLCTGLMLVIVSLILMFVGYAVRALYHGRSVRAEIQPLIDEF